MVIEDASCDNIACEIVHDAWSLNLIMWCSYVIINLYLVSKWIYDDACMSKGLNAKGC